MRAEISAPRRSAQTRAHERVAPENQPALANRVRLANRVAQFLDRLKPGPRVARHRKYFVMMRRESSKVMGMASRSNRFDSRAPAKYLRLHLPLPNV